MESKANLGVEEAAVYLLCIPLQNTHNEHCTYAVKDFPIIVVTSFLAMCT